MKRVPASSSNIASYGYDAERGVLEVEFHGGRVYHYKGVASEVFEEFKDSPSMGAFFSSRIRMAYETVLGTYEGEDEVPSVDVEVVEEEPEDGVTWGKVVEGGLLAGRLTHPYASTTPYRGCAECSFGPGALIHNGYTGRVPDEGEEEG